MAAGRAGSRRPDTRSGRASPLSRRTRYRSLPSPADRATPRRTSARARTRTIPPATARNCARRAARSCARWPLEEVVRDAPLLSARVPEELRARHEENSPALVPHARLRGAVSRFENGPQRRSRTILFSEPRVRGLLVMPAIPAPAASELERILKAQRQLVARHHAAGEEVPAHPVVVVPGFERIRYRAMAEHVHEELPARSQRLVDSAQEPAPVPHVLEHLDRDDPIVEARRHECIHVASNNLDLLQAGACRLAFDEVALRPRVRYGGDPRIGKALGKPQRKRAPAAAQLENTVAVGDLRALGRDAQRRLLRFHERRASRRPVAAAVLAPRP